MLFSSLSAAQTRTLTTAQEAVVAEFRGRVNAYVKMRERIEGEMPKLPVEATAEQIEAHKKALFNNVHKARVGNVRGNIFTLPIARTIRTILKTQLTADQRKDMRAGIIKESPRGVPLRVNASYPSKVEQLEMPPDLLLVLPQLPKQVKYRYVGANLLLVDRENDLIIDYMTSALP